MQQDTTHPQRAPCAATHPSALKARGDGALSASGGNSDTSWHSLEQTLPAKDVCGSHARHPPASTTPGRAQLPGRIQRDLSAQGNIEMEECCSLPLPLPWGNQLAGIRAEWQHVLPILGRRGGLILSMSPETTDLT